MVYVETLLNFPDWMIPFVVYAYVSDKQVGAVISQNNKPIELLLRRLLNPQRNYTNTDKELLAIV